MYNILVSGWPSFVRYCFLWYIFYNRPQSPLHIKFHEIVQAVSEIQIIFIYKNYLFKGIRYFNFPYLNTIRCNKMCNLNNLH